MKIIENLSCSQRTRSLDGRFCNTQIGTIIEATLIDIFFKLRDEERQRPWFWYDFDILNLTHCQLICDMQRILWHVKFSVSIFMLTKIILNKQTEVLEK